MYYKYLVVVVVLFLLGGWGVVLNRGHFIIMIVSIELVLLATFFLFLINSKEIDALIEQVFMIMGLTIAAAESSIGLALLVAYYRIRGTIVLKSLSSLRG
uniref:NADH dehydrogenase subunit 4L n=1 Tax=Caryophyllia scobinosa TaxID=691193 RepID=UPI002176EDD6|nr:NADH dehydrogenase subunit 4L [Caryophyllia scobinosa]UUF92250.1 NADH dehydrogenase subunit 4L [Caryophyllia scobinosa]